MSEPILTQKHGSILEIALNRPDTFNAFSLDMMVMLGDALAGARPRVKLTTIHQAKGLQFDIVVLPELDGDVVGQSDPVVTHRGDCTLPVDCVCRYASANIQQLLPASFQQMFEAATDRAVTESLCVLYVAVTRAERKLVLSAREGTGRRGSWCWSCRPTRRIWPGR